MLSCQFQGSQGKSESQGCCQESPEGNIIEGRLLPLLCTVYFHFCLQWHFFSLSSFYVCLAVSASKVSLNPLKEIFRKQNIGNHRMWVAVLWSELNGSVMTKHCAKFKVRHPVAMCLQATVEAVSQMVAQC